MKIISFGPASSVMQCIMLLFAVTSCTKELKIKPVYQLMGNATASLQGDTIVSDGFATLSGTYNSGTKTLNYTITWKGLTGLPRGIHFHGPSVPRAASNPLVDIEIEPWQQHEEGSITGSAIIPANQEKDLLAQRWTFQFHTIRYRPGEIRGFVIAK